MKDENCHPAGYETSKTKRKLAILPPGYVKPKNPSGKNGNVLPRTDAAPITPGFRNILFITSLTVVDSGKIVGQARDKLNFCTQHITHHASYSAKVLMLRAVEMSISQCRLYGHLIPVRTNSYYKMSSAEQRSLS